MRHIERGRTIGAKNRRFGKQEDPADTKRLRVTAAMCRTGSAIGKEHEVAGIETLEHDFLEDLHTHLLIRDALDGKRCLLDAYAHGFGDGPADCPARFTGLEFHSSPKEIVRIQIAQHDVGIGDRGLGSTQTITSRTGHGSGTGRTDLQPVSECCVEPGD